MEYPRTYYYVHNFPFPSEKAHGMYIAKSCEAMSQLGYESHVIVSKRKRSAYPNAALHYGLSTPLIVHRTLTTGILPHPKSHSVATAIFALEACIKIIFLKPTIIQTPDPEIIAGLTILKLCGLKSKIIYDIHLNQPDWIIQFLKFVTLFVVDATMYQEWLEKHCQYPLNILNLPMGYDPKPYSQLPSIADIRHQLDLPMDKFIIGYIGRFETMGVEKGLYQLIKIIGKMSKTHPVFMYLVGGPETLAQKYREYATSLGLGPDVFRIIGEVSPLDVGLHMKACDLGWLIYPNNPRFKYGISPMKQLEYAAAQVPIIASDFPTITSNMPSELLTLVDPDNEESIINNVEEIIRNYSKYKNKSASLYQYLSKYTWINRQKQILSCTK